jgi:hypothetical protein
MLYVGNAVTGAVHVALVTVEGASVYLNACAEKMPDTTCNLPNAEVDEISRSQISALSPVGVIEVHELPPSLERNNPKPLVPK